MLQRDPRYSQLHVKAQQRVNQRLAAINAVEIYGVARYVKFSQKKQKPKSAYARDILSAERDVEKMSSARGERSGAWQETRVASPEYSESLAVISGHKSRPALRTLQVSRDSAVKDIVSLK